MIISCTSCSRKMQVPEDAAGKQVRCPNCQAVIRVSESAPPAAAPPPQRERIQPTAPPPLPEPAEEFEEQPRRRREDDRFAYGDQGDDDFNFRRPRSGQVATGGTVVLLYVAFSVDVLLAVLLLVGNLVTGSLDGGGPANRGANTAGGVLCFMIFLSMSPFVLLAGIFLSRLTNRGLVMTGGIMAIVIGSLATIGGIITLFAVVSLTGLAAGRLPGILYVILYALVLFYVLVAILNFLSGIKALVIIGQPAIKERFRANSFSP